VTNVAWITSTYPWPDEPIGGIFFRTQARALARTGVGVAVVTPTPWAPWPLPRLRATWASYSHSPRRMTDQGVTILRPRYASVPGQPDWARPDWFVAQAALRTRQDWRTAKLVHGHYSVQGLAAWRISRRTGLPYVLTFHGSDINVWPTDHPGRIGDLRHAARDAAKVLAVSPALVDRIGDITGVRAVHLPIGCDLDALAAGWLPRMEARGQLDLPRDAVVALFVGRLTAEKGLREFVDALLRLGGSYLGVIVGDGPEAGYGLDDPRAGGHLTYVGRRPNEEVIRYMSAADALVLPSYAEGTPTVLVEAGALGLPVIASAVGGIPDLLGSDRGRLLPEISATAIADALLELAHRRGDAEECARRLKAHVAEHHSAARNAGLLAEIYEAAVAGVPAVDQTRVPFVSESDGPRR